MGFPVHFTVDMLERIGLRKKTCWKTLLRAKNLFNLKMIINITVRKFNLKIKKLNLQIEITTKY